MNRLGPFLRRISNPSGRLAGCVFKSVGFFSSSDYAELTEHSCSTDYARNLNGFGLAAIGLAHNHCSSPVAISLLVQALGGIATTVRSSFRLNSVSNPRKEVKVPFIPHNPMNDDTPSL